ncbi:MAG TPA: tRNA uridine-5-carboxymethylaminomethyl(34) synthesis GTPase MnmE [Verrucomicrobiae bacterium]|nr:tRNA uridine-5-carboxymethylaminomethyl(34) synthesis GTPase MnmE [Verrucomicrobiae bacterium]
MSDTIAAVATAPGRGAVGIVRLSGPRAFEIIERMCGPATAARQAALRTLGDGHGSALDQGLVLRFPGPHSFTGEDVAEMQGHGGPVVLDALLRATCALGARVARPGEFSERAFLNGRIDLAQAEAVADLIAASTDQAARAAQRSLSGEFSRRVTSLVEQLMQLRVHVEGALDFSDEDVDWLADAGLASRLAGLRTGLDALLADAAQGRRLREGITVALAGQPNVGKSTLLNALAGTDAAIVTDIPGTTRDLLRENVNLDGLPVTLVDTAGLRESADPVERIGVERAWQAMAQAELVLFLVDDRAGVTASDKQLLAKLPKSAEVLILRNKSDLAPQPPSIPSSHEAAYRGTELQISAKHGAGLDLLKQAIRHAAGLEARNESLFSARTRHVDALRRAREHAAAAAARLAERAHAELAAEDLRLAQDALGEITGAVRTDDLLGRIFSQFCIGK